MAKRKPKPLNQADWTGQVTQIEEHPLYGHLYFWTTAKVCANPPNYLFWVQPGVGLDASMNLLLQAINGKWNVYVRPAQDAQGNPVMQLGTTNQVQVDYIQIAF